MRKYLLVLFSVMTIVYIAGCSNEEENKTTDELKEDIKESEEELQELYKESGSKSDDNSKENIEEEESDSNTDKDTDNNENDEVEEKTIEDEIESEINNIVGEDLDDTEITNVKINEDASTDEERYIVLIDLRWDVKNRPGTTEEMIDMYSDHLAAKMKDYDEIYEFVEFWEIPYHKEDETIIKKTYENVDDGMMLQDEMKDNDIFN